MDKKAEILVQAGQLFVDGNYPKIVEVIVAGRNCNRVTQMIHILDWAEQQIQARLDDHISLRTSL